MKETLYIIFMLIEIFCYSQDYSTLQSKYWYYRTRLRNDFMEAGSGQGSSIPMEERGDGYEPYYNDSQYNFNFSNNPNDGTQVK